MRSLLPPLLLAAGVLSGAPPSADNAASVRTLDTCLETLMSKMPGVPTAHTAPKGIDGLRPLCPELERVLEDSNLTAQLPEHWQQALDYHTLADLSWLLKRYQSSAASSAPRVPTLYQVARTLNQPQPRHSWWADFKDWLRQLLLRRATPDSSLLNRWLSWLTLPQSLLRLIADGLLAAVLLLAAWIMRREWLAARAGASAARPGAGDARRVHGPLTTADASAPGIGELEHVPPLEQPALLLRLLVRALQQSGRLRGDRNLTHRELAARSAFDDPQQHASFERVSLLAERLLYGANMPGAAGAQTQFEHTLAHGRQLYAQLLASRAATR